MAYNPTTWGTGDTITASALNKIEQGIVGAESSGGGYDAVLYVYHSNSTSTDLEVTIESGTYAEIAGKVANDEPPIILVKVWDELAGVFTTTTAVPIYAVEFNEDPARIVFHIYAQSAWEVRCYTYLKWDEDNEVYFD